MLLAFKHLYLRWLKNQIYLFILSAIMMSVARGMFTLYFGDWGEIFSQTNVLLKAFWLGFRFDLIPLAYINALPFVIIHLGYMVRGKRAIRIFTLLNRFLLSFGLILLFWIYIFDYAFYSYFQDHINILFFGFLEDDTKALLVSIWKNYNIPVWLALIIIVHWLVFKFVFLAFSTFDFDLSVKKFNYWVPINLFFGLVVLVFLGRGNFTRLPLSIEDAHISSLDFINKLPLNGVVSLNRAIKIRRTFGEKEFDYSRKFKFSSWQEAYQTAWGKAPDSGDFFKALRHSTPQKDVLEKNPPHVVLIVMESFGSYWNENHQERFNLLGDLEKHMKEGILFKNFLPAENGTIGSIVSIATAQPIRPGARFLSESSFMKTPLESSGSTVYKKAGYDTHFVYGGKLGWRDLGKYLAIQGFDHLWGADEIKEAIPELNNIEPRDLGNEWGIFDEYLYGFIEEQLRYATKPQFFLILTTSNHPPFEYPSTYHPMALDISSELSDKLTLDNDLAKKRFLGVQYANHKVGEFISKLELTGLHQKTVLAMTGDHSYWIAKGIGLEQEFKRYAVPFLLVIPSYLRPSKVNTDNVGSHEDIFPTLFHLTLSNVDYIKLGENLLSEDGFALNSSDIVASQEGAFHHNQSWDWVKDQLMMLTLNKDLKKWSALRRKKEAHIALTDLYLKEERKRKQTDAKNGRP